MKIKELAKEITQELLSRGYLNTQQGNYSLPNEIVLSDASKVVEGIIHKQNEYIELD